MDESNTQDAQNDRCAGMPKLPLSDITDPILHLFQELNDFYIDIGLIQL